MMTIEYKTCPICYADYLPTKGNQVYCHECRKYRKPEIEHYTQVQRQKALREAEHAVSRFPSINDITADLMEYNEKYGTNYHYGLYVGLRDNGWLKE